MRSVYFLALAGWLSAGSVLFAQDPTPTSESRLWGGAEYLMWWLRPTPLPPLVTTGSMADLPPGALGQPGTSVLYGGAGDDLGTFSGLRFNLGGWGGSEQLLGLETSFFFLEHRSQTFTAASDAAGSPPLFIPFYNAFFGFEDSLAISFPAFPVLTGTTVINSSSRLWGAEVNPLCNLIRNDIYRLDLLVGFRYLDLDESLHIFADSNLPLFSMKLQTQDGFHTRNQFWGGQVGGKVGLDFGRLGIDMACKVALGTTHQVVNVDGASLITGPLSGTFAGGLFALPTNMGRVTHDQFAVVPQVQLKVIYDLWRNLRAFAGYDFLYWSQVVRPGDQMDRSLNLTQFLGGTLVGPPSPAPLFNRTDFWAHGVNFGMELRF